MIDIIEQYNAGERDFRCVILEGADLKYANLKGANLEGANLKGANLEGANLEGANLRNVNLRYTYLEGANLEGANLRNVNLRYTYLGGANLKGANLRNVNLTSADLRNADLRRANIDMSCLPLWCGSLGMRVDKRIAVQIAYHLCSLNCDDPEYLDVRKACLNFANLMHRTDVPRLE